MTVDEVAKLKDSPVFWVVTVVLLLLLWEGGKKWVPGAIEWVVRRLTSVLAGTRLMRSRSLRTYRDQVAKRYARLPVLFMPSDDIDVSSVYVPLQASDAGGSHIDDVYGRIRSTDHVVVLGGPGSGKSMLLRHSILTWALGQRRRTGRIPVLLELHRCNGNTTPLIELIVDQFAANGFRRATRFVQRALQDGGLALLFDGLDEVGASERNRVTQMLRDFAAGYSGCQIVVTCRTAIYDRTLSPEITATFHVAPFDERHIQRFLRQWPSIIDETQVERLLTALRNTPRLMQLASNPLLLTMIAYLYSGSLAQDRILPHSRAEFYREVTEELLDRLKHEANRFEGRKKKAVLKRLALVAQDTPSDVADRRALRTDRVFQEIEAMLPRINLAATDIDDLLREIVDRSGLLLRIDGGDRYQFAHLTLQEYLAAVALEDDMDGLLTRYRAAPDDWREVIKLWCGSADRDSSPLIEQVYQIDTVLALECLADAQVVDEAVAERITSHFKDRINDPSGTPDAVIAAFGLVAADPRPRGRHLYEFLVTSSRQHPATPVLAALAATKLPDAATQLAAVADVADVAFRLLVTMGDLAVPALAEAVRAGRLEALDALQAVGTPAAAVVLARLLWADDETLARRAAWRLSTLTADSNVELALADVTIPNGNSMLPWVWTPFHKQCSPAFSGVAARVAWLLDNTPEDEVPTDVGPVDTRLVIPLCAVSGLQDTCWTVPEDIRQELTGLVDHRSVRGLHRIAGSPDAPTPRREIPDKEVRLIMQRVASWLADAQKIRSRYRSLFGVLDFRMQLGLLLRLWAVPADAQRWGSSIVTVDRRDWGEGVRNSSDAYVFRKSPAAFAMVAVSLAFFLAVVAGGCLLALHGWPLGPSWIGWGAAAISLAYHALFIGVILVNSDDPDFADALDYLVTIYAIGPVAVFVANHDLADMALGFAFTLCAFVDLGLVVVVGVHYVGWLYTAAGLVVLAGVIGGLYWYGAKRERAARNPLRGLLELDDLAARRRTSVIAP